MVPMVFSGNVEPSHPGQVELKKNFIIKCCMEMNENGYVCEFGSFIQN